jgi:hypothetical protein
MGIKAAQIDNFSGSVIVEVIPERDGIRLYVGNKDGKTILDRLFDESDWLGFCRKQLGDAEELRIGAQPWIDGPPKACGDYRLRTKQGGTECVTIRQVRGDSEYMACGTWNPMSFIAAHQSLAASPSPEPRRCEDGWIDGPPPENSGLCACEFLSGDTELVRGATLCRSDIVRHFRIPPPPSPPAPEPPKAVRVKLRDSEFTAICLPAIGGSDETVYVGPRDCDRRWIYWKESDVEILPAAESP